MLGCFIAYNYILSRKKKPVEQKHDSFVEEEKTYFTENELDDLTQDIKANLDCAIEGSKNS
jgi:hypothetical protein